MSGAGFGRIGHYELRGVLGRGGMATVYRAYSPSLRREVALKVLTAPESKLDILRERFRREAQVVGRMNHPNILPLLDSGEENGIPYLVSELIEGGSLNTRLGRPLPTEQAIAIARQIGSALDYAHARGIVHRDVKPANIFIDGDRAVLADFGIVKVFGEIGPKLTQTGIGVGTPEYTAPEQATGGALDGRSDLYALGIVLYEMLTGKPPYQGGTMDVINAHVQGQLPDPCGRNPALPHAVGAVLIKALARQPDRRYPTGAALADALESAITGTRPVPQPPAEAPAQTLMLNQTREMLFQTQIQNTPLPPGGDETVVMPRSTTPPPPSSTPPPGSTVPSLPAALPPTPTTPPPTSARPVEGATGDDRPVQRPIAPMPEPPRALPPTPLAANRPITPPPMRSLGGFTPADQTLPPQNQTHPLVAPPAAPPNQPYQPPLFVPPPPPPPPPPSLPNRPLVIGLSAAVVLLLVLIGVGGLYFARRDTTTTPTATTAAQATSTVPPTAAASPSASAGITPSATTRALTPTSATANDPAREQIAAGDAALKEGRFTEAVAAYKAGLAANPQSAIANRQLGLTLWVWNHDPGEIEYLEQATKLDPNDALAWAYLSFSSVDTHQSVRAYDAAYRAVGVNNNEPVAHAALANVYLAYPPDPADPASGKPEARQEVDKAKALDPNNLWVLWSESGILAHEEKYQESQAALDKMIEQRPNWATLASAKGVIYNSMDRDDDARTWLEKALALDPDYPYALTELGWLAYGDGDYQQAKQHFDHALVLIDEVSVSAHVGLGYTLLELGDAPNALLHCQRAAGIDTHKPDGFLCLGYVYEFGTGEDANATSAYRKAIELRPYLESGYIGIARIQSGQDDHVGAEATLKQGLSLVDKPQYIHFWLGRTLYLQGKYQEAQPNLERAAELVPDNADVQYLLGLNLEELDRFPEARAAYERALAIDPTYQDARDALDRLTREGH